MEDRRQSIDDDDDDDEETRLIRRACDAAMRNDANALAEALGFRATAATTTGSQRSLHSPLFNSTKNAQILHRRLFQNLTTNDEGKSDSRFRNNSRILRALLMVPPHYQTPWLAAWQFTESLQQQSENVSEKLSSATVTQPLSRSSLRSSVTEIQSFLQQTVSMWWEQERRRNSSARARQPLAASASAGIAINDEGKVETPRYWTLRLVQTLMKPLLLQQQPYEKIAADHTQRCLDDHWRMPLELVATIVTIMHDLEESLNQDILDFVFSLSSSSLEEKYIRIRPDRLLPWLSLATDLHAFLRPSDWKALLWTLQQKRPSQNDSIAATTATDQYTAFSIQEDLPGLMTATVSLSSTLLLNNSNGSSKGMQNDATINIFREWKQVVWNLFLAASADPNTFSTVTTVFRERLSGCPSDCLQEWISLDDDGSGEVGDDEDGDESIMNNSNAILSSSITPKWVKANMILAIMGSAKNSGSSLVDRLLSRALANTKGHYDVPLEGWRALMGLIATRDKIMARKRGKATTSQKSWFTNVENSLKGVRYIGNGRFASDQGHGSTLAICCQVGELIYESLFLKAATESTTTTERASSIYVVDRAQDWISAANFRLKSQDECLASQEVLVITVVFITVFCEVPLSRSFVARGMAQSLSGESDCLHSKRDMALLNCLVASVILSSNNENLAVTTALNPIVDVLAAGKLEKVVFIALVKAIAPTSSLAQQALLALARKRLQSPFGNILWGSETFDTNRDRIQCSLFSLCVLIKSPKWNENAAEAWKMLSEIMVLNRPALPIAARSWLFCQIQNLVDSEESFKQDVLDRICRASLVRLLQFVEDGETFGRANIDPRAAFVVWSTADAHVQCTLVEDIPGLYRLLFSLFFRIARSKGMNNHKGRVENGRILLLRSCCPKMSVEHYDGFGIKNDNSQILCTTAVVALVVSAIGFIQSLSLGDSAGVEAGLAVEFHLDTKSTGSQLIFEEEEVTLQQNFRPLWLDLLSDFRHSHTESLEPPAAALRELGISLCDTVAVFLKDHRWSFAISGSERAYLCNHHKNTILSLSFLSNAKKTLAYDGAPIAVETSGILSKVTSALSHTSFSDTSAFFAASATFVENALSDNLDRSELNSGFIVIMDFLGDLKEALAEEPRETSFRLDEDLSPVLTGLWAFYKRVCGEDASIRLISYLEESIATRRELSSSLKQRFFLESIESSGEIDAEIRLLRYSVLSALLGCLNAVLKSGTCSKLFTTSPLLEFVNDETDGLRYRWSTEFKIRPTDFFSTCLVDLVDDLQTGVNGHSGGISTEMYVAYVDSLDTISTLLALQAQQISGGASEMLCLYNHTCESAQKIQTVFCSFPPKKKAPFTKALLLLSRTLPLLARCAARNALLAENEATSARTKEVLESGQRGIDFAFVTFEECATTLSKWYDYDPLFRSSWARASIPQVGDDYNDDDEQSMLLDESSPIKDSAVRQAPPGSSPQAAQIPSVVTVTKQPTSQSRPGKDGLVQKLTITSKDIWSWTCSSSVVAMESIFIEAIKAMSHRANPRGLTNYEIPVSTGSSSYVLQRAAQLGSVFRALGIALAAQNRRKTTDADRPEVEKSRQTWGALIELFPDDGKHKVISLIHRIVAATDASLQILESLIQQRKTAESNMCFLEALVCLLVFCRVDETETFDLFYYFRKWHEFERGRVNRSEDVDRKDIMRQFPRVLFRMEKVESNFRKLYHKVADMKTIRVKKALALDETLAQLATCGLSCSGHSFSGMMKQKLDVMTQMQVKLRESGHPLLSRVAKRKRTTRRKDFHRPPIRSRNATVDNWLGTDQKMGDADDGSDDAYLDLEDFIADG